MELAWEGNYLKVFSNDHYEFVHEADSVMMLPRVNKEIVVRLEPCTPYQIKGENEHYWTPVCGTKEEGEHVFETLQREMGEETPVYPNKIRLLREMKYMPYTKLTTQRVSFFAFDVLDYETTGAPGDGSDYEEKSRHALLEEEELHEVAEEENADLGLRFCSEVLKNI